MVNAAQRTRVKVEADNRPSVDTHPPGVQPSPGTGGTRHHNFMLCVVLAVPVFSLVLAGTALFTKQRRASPDDGLITQSIRAAATAGVLLCFVEKPTDLAESI
ncbi:hypothetical protein P8612_05855 [Escherichia coli]|uniref:hypothetical protein n=1 Tax=Escherichia coli TaxID=562 RepID=UPI0026136EDE|nr:hypothetical protein [Escherichia coli]WGJ39278.1 hypothetical protein P8612_05855 [Escherichia coli]